MRPFRRHYFILVQLVITSFLVYLLPVQPQTDKPDQTKDISLYRIIGNQNSLRVCHRPKLSVSQTPSCCGSSGDHLTSVSTESLSVTEKSEKLSLFSRGVPIWGVACEFTALVGFHTMAGRHPDLVETTEP
ncbi:hypothetical protein BaRGS_00013055 [Batillaria attramentaria]|uniref:Uncharacterized protein n=1 Tax=Batillaria attramentaria TaxID=370345 RepID=A0ABD0L7Z7_9CAEN